MDGPEFAQILSEVAQTATQRAVFGVVSTEGDRLTASAARSSEPAFYRVDLIEGEVWVSLVTGDRWLSESIEATLMNSGDKIDELLDEEMVDQGFDGGALGVMHFRSDDMLYTFRSRVPEQELNARSIAQVLLGYEACFGQLGDMDPGEEG